MSDNEVSCFVTDSFYYLGLIDYNANMYGEIRRQI